MPSSGKTASTPSSVGTTSSSIRLCASPRSSFSRAWRSWTKVCESRTNRSKLRRASAFGGCGGAAFEQRRGPIHHLPLSAVGEHLLRVRPRDPAGLFDLDPHSGIELVDSSSHAAEEEKMDLLEDLLSPKLVDVLDVAQRSIELDFQTGLLEHLARRRFRQSLHAVDVTFGEGPDGPPPGTDHGEGQASVAVANHHSASRSLARHSGTMSNSGSVRQVAQLGVRAQPVAVAQVSEQPIHPARGNVGNETRAIRPGEAVGFRVAPHLIRGELRVEGHPVEQPPMQLARPIHRPIVPPMKQAAGKLVDFGLSLELEKRNGSLLAGGMGDVQEVRYPLGCLTVVSEIFFQRARENGGRELPELLEELGRQVKPQPQLIVLLVHQELFSGPARSAQQSGRPLVEQIFADAVRTPDSVDRLEMLLNPTEQGSLPSSVGPWSSRSRPHPRGSVRADCFQSAATTRKP